MHIAIRRNTDLLRESRSSRYSRRKILTLMNFPGYVIGQGHAKKVLSVAVQNHYKKHADGLVASSCRQLILVC